MLVKRYRCALRNPAWSISPTVQIRDVSLAMIQPRPRPIFHRLKSTCTCLYRAAAGLVVLLHKRGVPTGYLEAQSRKRTRKFSDPHRRREATLTCQAPPTGQTEHR